MSRLPTITPFPARSNNIHPEPTEVPPRWYIVLSTDIHIVYIDLTENRDIHHDAPCMALHQLRECPNHHSHLPQCACERWCDEDE